VQAPFCSAPPSASASAPAINNNPQECEYVGETGAVHDPYGTCTAADIEAANNQRSTHRLNRPQQMVALDS
jgi:hypothetical protein